MGVRKLGPAKWEASYRDPQRKERIKTFRTRAEADRWLATVKTDLTRGAYVDPRLARTAFGEWADDWLATTAHLRAKTRVGYESDLRVHVLPVFAHRSIGSIQQVDVRRFVADMIAQGAAPGTVRNARKVLRLVLGTAQGSGAIRTNPCDGVRVPASPKTEMVFLTPEQVERLAAAIGPRHATLVRFAAYRSARWRDLRSQGRPPGPPTRPRPRRRIRDRGGGPRSDVRGTEDQRAPLGDAACLPQGRVRCSLGRTARQAGRLRLPVTERGVLRHKMFYKRVFKPAVVAAGLPPGLRYHDLRHTCASLCIALGAHPKAIQERLGHSSITVTLDRYGHLFPKLDEALTERLDLLRNQAAETMANSPSPAVGEVRRLGARDVDALP